MRSVEHCCLKKKVMVSKLQNNFEDPLIPPPFQRKTHYLYHLTLAAFSRVTLSFHNINKIYKKFDFKRLEINTSSEVVANGSIFKK